MVRTSTSRTVLRVSTRVTKIEESVVVVRLEGDLLSQSCLEVRLLVDTVTSIEGLHRMTVWFGGGLTGFLRISPDLYVGTSSIQI